MAITLTGPEPVSYDDDCRYGGNVCHSDVPTNICRSPAHALLHEPLPAKELPRQKCSVLRHAQKKLRQIKLR
ncbi:hypothetical protein LTSEBAI_2275, partial [Salmonella enterica subsp. enterica serovar Baildon str. R6-199]